jgi:hypothetical protein
MELFTTTGEIIMDRKLKEQLKIFIDVTAFTIMIGSFLQVFIFGNQDWFGAMVFCLGVVCFIPLFE